MSNIHQSLPLNFQLPQHICATYKIITPMFIGDADLKATGISPQSFKGVLRFWWRALVWGRIRQSKANDADALKALHHEEALLFGSSADNPHAQGKDHKIYGKGKVAIKIKKHKLTTTQAGNVHPNLKNDPASRYLGYGVIEAFASRVKGIQAGQLVRDCINENQEFTVTILVNGEKYIDDIKKALQLLGLLGGLGSKVRKGFGSLNLQSLTCDDYMWQAPQSLDDYQHQVATLLTNLTEQIPPFSALSRQSFFTTTSVSDTSYRVLNDYGKAMMMYRSWGKDGKVLESDAERNFPEDHDWSKRCQVFSENHENLDFNNFHPKRVVFGLPHNYGKLQVGRDLGRQYGRRTSPLFFHIQQIGNKFVGIAYILRAQFLPANERIKADRNSAPQNIDWAVLQQQFLMDKQRFPDASIIYQGAAQ